MRQEIYSLHECLLKWFANERIKYYKKVIYIRICIKSHRNMRNKPSTDCWLLYHADSSYCCRFCILVLVSNDVMTNTMMVLLLPQSIQWRCPYCIAYTQSLFTIHYFTVCTDNRHLYPMVLSFSSFASVPVKRLQFQTLLEKKRNKISFNIVFRILIVSTCPCNLSISLPNREYY